MIILGNKERDLIKHIDKPTHELTESLASLIIELAEMYIEHEPRSLSALVGEFPPLLMCIKNPSVEVKQAVIINDAYSLKYADNINLADIKYLLYCNSYQIESLNELPLDVFRCLDMQSAELLFENDRVDNACFDNCKDLDWYEELAPLYKLKEL